jgi:hypothetical protein
LNTLSLRVALAVAMAAAVAAEPVDFVLEQAFL